METGAMWLFRTHLFRRYALQEAGLKQPLPGSEGVRQRRSRRADLAQAVARNRQPRLRVSERSPNKLTARRKASTSSSSCRNSASFSRSTSLMFFIFRFGGWPVVSGTMAPRQIKSSLAGIPQPRRKSTSMFAQLCHRVKMANLIPGVLAPDMAAAENLCLKDF